MADVEKSPVRSAMRAAIDSDPFVIVLSIKCKMGDLEDDSVDIETADSNAWWCCNGWSPVSEDEMNALVAAVLRDVADEIEEDDDEAAEA